MKYRNNQVFKNIILRSVGAAFAFATFVLGRFYLDDAEFGQLAYLLQSITILVVFGQIGLEFLLQRSSARDQFRVTSYLVFIGLTAAPPICFISIVTIQLVTGKTIEPYLLILILLISYVIILNRCIASIYLGTNQIYSYQIWDQVTRWLPFGAILAIAIALDFFGFVSFDLNEIILCATILYLVLLLVASLGARALPVLNPLKISFRIKLYRNLFVKGMMVNTPNTILFLASVTDQLILIRFLSLSDYGIYRFSMLAVTVFVMLLDVVGLLLRRQYFRERNLENKKHIYGKLCVRLRALALLEITIGAVLLILSFQLPYQEYTSLAGLLMLGHGVSLLFGDPMFLLKANDRQNTATVAVFFAMIISVPIAWFLISEYDLYGAALAFGAISILTRLLLMVSAKISI